VPDPAEGFNRNVARFGSLSGERGYGVNYPRRFGFASSLLSILFSFCIAPTAWGLTISEIMYNPGPEGTDLVEFIEIYNEDGEARDLSYYDFGRGVTFSFPGYREGTPVFIRGKSFLVVTNDVGKLLKLYPHLANTNPLFPQVVGPYSGLLDNGGETITLNNPGGAVDARVGYNNRGGWPAGADGTGHSIILKNPDLDDPGDGDNWTISPLRGGSPGLANFGEKVFTETVLVPPNETWRLWKGSAEPSTPKEAWRQKDFADAAWEDALMPVGFGTNCGQGTALGDMMNGYISVYLRKTFQVADPASVDILTLRMKIDDGFIAYLNGTEIAKRNMNNGDAFDAKASSSGNCATTIEFDVVDPRSKLVAGENVLCIQAHNSLIGNNDFGVSPDLISKKGRDIGTFPQLDVDINEILWNTAETKWVEIHNDQDAEQDISGFFLSDDPAVLDKFTFPPETKIPPRGFLVVEAGPLAQAAVTLDVPLAGAASPRKFLALTRSVPVPGPGGPAGSAGYQVVDARSYSVEPSPGTVGMSEARYPDGNSDWVLARTASRGAANKFEVDRNIVINEIMYHPFYPYKNDHVPGTNGFEKPEDQGEYIEIYNRGDAAVNLGGWTFSRGVEFEFAPGTMIEPGAYLVVARDPDFVRTQYGLPAAQVFGPWYNVRYDDQDQAVFDTAVLADGGERVELSDPIGNPVDSVRYYDNGRWSQWADTRGSSLERIDPHQKSNRAGNWDASDESGKSEWTHYSWKGRYTESEKELQFMLLTRGIVLIDNLSVTDPTNPGAGNYLRGGDFEAALNATWNFDGTHIYSGRTTADKKDGAACLKLIATGRGNNRIDRARYNAPAFPTNRELLLEFDARWICGEGTLMFTSTWNNFAHRFFLKVPEKNGTPGMENSVRLRLPDKLHGPLVENVRQEPVLPAAGQDVVVKAEVSDSDGVAAVKLRYSLDSVRAAATEVPMLDDGQGADRDAGDGTYTAVIPGQANGRRVVFSIEATDTESVVGRFPFDDRRRTHPYLLDPGTQDPTKLRYAVYIHGAVGSQTGGVPEYRMLMTQENSTYLTTRNTMNNDVIDSSFVWNDKEIWYNMGVRYGNSPWTRPGGKSYVVKLPRENELQGYKKFKLDNRGSEINERVVYYLIRSNNNFGRDAAPFGRSTYARPFFNGSSAGSVFERVEIPSKQFLERWWPNDSEGVLYKVDDLFLVNLPQGNHRANRDAFVRYPPDGGGNGENEEEYRWYFLHRSREKYDDFSEMIDLAKFFTPTQTNAQAYNAGLFDKVNVESTLRTFAVEVNVGDWDTWGTDRGKNCFFYRPRIDGRWVLIGWDKDLTFENPNDGRTPIIPGKFQETARLVNSPGGKRVYHSVMNEMLATFYNASYLNRFFSEHAKDKNGRAIVGLPGSATTQANFLTGRSSVMRAAVGQTNVKFELVTGGAEGVVNSTEPTINVEGTAPLTLAQIVVKSPAWVDQQGKEVDILLDVNRGDLTWTTTTRWRTAAPLAIRDGETPLTFIGFGQDGTLLAVDQLKALYNTNWEPPVIGSIQPAQGPLAGGTEVLVKGTGFRSGAKVFFGAASAVVKTLDEAAGSIVVVAPAAAGPGVVDVKVTNLDGKSGTFPGGFSYGGARFNRGDVDINRTVNLTDAILILNYQFLGEQIPCLDAADVNDDGVINLTDPIAHLLYQFLGGEPPAAPFDPTGAAAGDDPTPGDPLGCAQSL